MVLILDGNSEHVAHARTKKSFRIKNIGFVATFEIIKCSKKIKTQRLLHTCAPISGLPSNISAMSNGMKKLLHVVP